MEINTPGVEKMTYTTTRVLRRLAPPAHQDIIDGVSSYFNTYAAKYGVITDLRICHFLAQAAVESAWFQTLTEYASGNEYEGRSDLGNTQPGDGVRYKGRGIFQVTGRANYDSIGKTLGLNLINQPELLATPQYAVMSAFEFWKMRNLNKVADTDDVNEVTRLINGGYNGINDRRTALANMKIIMSGSIDDIGPGDKGSGVVDVQTALKNKGYKIGLVDGDYGPATTAAVKQFQSDMQVRVTGAVDKNTLRLLEK